MNLLILPDVLLRALGLPVLSPRLGKAARRRKSVCRSTLNRPMRAATALLFCLGLSGCTTAGIDAGLAGQDPAHRHGIADNIRKNMMAPDFCLPTLDEHRTVRLSDFRGHKPVVLIFGNFY